MTPFGLRGWDHADIADPYPVYQRYREVAPVHRGGDTCYVFGYDEVETVLGGKDFGRSARTAGAQGLVPPGHDVLRTMVENWLVFLDPPRHTEVRSVLNKEFSPRVVSNLRVRIEEIADGLLAPLTGEIDFVESFAAPFPILVISELLGVPEDQWVWLRDRAVALQGASSSRGGDYGVADVAARELSEYFLKLARRRISEPGPDLISLLVKAGTLDDDMIAATCVHLMTAGHETTTNVIAKSVLALLADRTVLDQLREQPAFLPNAVEELTRYDSPVQAVTRWAYQDLRLGGLDIPRGTKVVALLGSANRDPKRFPDPDLLDIHRPPGRQVGFGMGIHYCLGATLARSEAEIGLGALLSRFDFTLAAPPVYANDMVFHGPESLVLHVS